ncbi:hypothetical protein, partial [Ferroplasma sp.]|uniref:hypothetical protein n=1 Tax=Ferroplasma sp. TaxID=2591003 RepID=UPI00307F0DF2
EITLKKNKVHAILTSNGITVKATDLFGKRGLKQINNSMALLDISDQFVTNSLLNDILFIKEQELNAEKKISEIAVDNDNIKLLMTVPGINYYTVQYILK